MVCPKCNEDIARIAAAKCGGGCKRKFHDKCLTRVKRKCGSKWICDDCYSNPKKKKKGNKNRSVEDARATSTKDTDMTSDTPVKTYQPATRRTSYSRQEFFHEKRAPRPVTFQNDDISRKLDDLSKHLERLSTEMGTVKNENVRLKDDNQTLKLAISHMCVRPCETDCAGVCNRKREYPMEECKATAPPVEPVVEPHEVHCSYCTVSCRQCAVSRPTSVPTDVCPKASEDGFRIISVDPCITRNGSTHKTGMFDLMRTGNPHLVVRRGEPFVLEITLNRPFDEDTDHFSFMFYHTSAEFPSVGRKTMVAVPFLFRDDKNMKWRAVLDESEGNKITVFINSSADTAIGKWRMEIDAIIKNRAGASTFKYKDPIYILFNAWCKEDVVYIDVAENRKEYVGAEVGAIWKGSVGQMHKSLWKYGQYDKDILDCSLMLLEKISKLPIPQWGDSVAVARAVSSAVNSPDDNGVVKGNWSEDFSGGKSPFEWLGSVKILQKFYVTRKPIKYGQCFVFAGVSTTVLRALGIPTRTVTGYKVGHDSGYSLTLDIFVDETGAILKEFSNDIIWNYHVWTEIWTKRLDLHEEYNGWQVVDGTPQELSDNMYRCGPAPIAAVKRGDIFKPYDVAFVYSEVNADVIFWRFQGLTQPLKLLSTDTDQIGKSISTKAVGSFDREDITHLYKYDENSKEERGTMVGALRMSKSLVSRYYLNESFNDVKFDYHLQKDIVIGSTYRICLGIKNVSKNQHKIKITMRSTIMKYFGDISDVIKVEDKRVTVPPESDEEAVMVLEYKDYAPHFSNPDSIFHLSAMCKVEGTDYEYLAQDQFRITLPTINIEVQENPIADKDLFGTASFRNPLPEKLTNCMFLIEGPGLIKCLKYKIADIPACEEAKVNFKMVPTFYGKQSIIAKFSSNNLKNVDGFVTIQIMKNSNTHNNVR